MIPDRSWFDPVLQATLHTGNEATYAILDLVEHAAPRSVPIAIDIETPGLGTFTINCVTAAWEQRGETHAVLLLPDDTSEITTLCEQAGELILHNASFDIPILWHHNLVNGDDIAKVTDTLLTARLALPDTHVPKTLAACVKRWLGMSDFEGGMALAFKAAGFKTQQEGFERMTVDSPVYRLGAMADTVMALKLAPVVHDAARAWLTDHPFQSYGASTIEQADAIIAVPHTVHRMMLRRSALGLAVDIDYLNAYIEQVAAERAKDTAMLTRAGLAGGAGQGPRLVAHLESAGELPPGWPLTATGKLKATKDLLDSLDHPLAKAQRRLADTDKILGYLDKVSRQADLTGRCHPQVAVLGASATGRMCLPTTHGILTARGVIKHDQVRMWDMTIDMDGNWVPVTGVYHYTDSPTVIRTGRNTRLEATAEHRWVSHSEYGQIHVAELEPGQRRMVHLAPLVSDFDPRGPRTVDALTDGERFAAVIGMLVTDGRCAKGTDGGIRPVIYQTEQKFYDEFIRVIPPDAVMSDRIRPNMGDCHEIRLRARWLTPLLKKAGLSPDPHLSDDPNLVNWVLSLTMRECAAFLRAAQLGDGVSSTAQTQRITTARRATADAFKVAAYRLGLRTREAVIAGTGQGYTGRTIRGRPLVSHKQVIDVILLPPTVSTDSMDIAVGRCDVWCVTTTTGTFTAWDEGPYLTGNSYSAPELHQFPADARPIIVADDGYELTSIDWSTIEPVMMALMAGDTGFLEPFEAGADLYEPVQRGAGVDRPTAKVVVLALMYGQGTNSLSRVIGHSPESAAQVRRQVLASMPRCAEWMSRVQTVGAQHHRVITAAGRILPVAPDRSYACVNHVVQGSAADLLYAALCEAGRRGLGEHVLLTMHDEIVTTTEAADEMREIMSTPPPWLKQWAGRTPLIRTDRTDMGRSWHKV